MKKFPGRLAVFLRSIHLTTLDLYLPAILTLRRRKYDSNCPPFFFVTTVQFFACAMRENLFNRYSAVQIPRDIFTRLWRYLYSTKCSWIINHHIQHHVVWYQTDIPAKQYADVIYAQKQQN